MRTGHVHHIKRCVPPSMNAADASPLLASLLARADGYSTSRTCEMSLSNHSGINFRGLVYLVDEATVPKKAAAAASKKA